MIVATLAILMIPMAIVFTFPIGLTIFCFNVLLDKFEDSGIFCSISISICLFNCGCILNAIIIPAGLLVIPYLFCYGFFGTIF